MGNNIVLYKILMLSLSFALSNVMAQSGSDKTDSLDWILKRMALLDLELKVQNLKDRRRGLYKQKHFIALFDEMGHFVEHVSPGISISELNRVASDKHLTVLPYTLSTIDERNFVSIPIENLKKLNPRSTDDFSFLDIGKKLNTVVYEFEKLEQVNGISKENLRIVEPEVKLDLLYDSRPGDFLAIVGQGSLGWEKERFVTPEERLGLTREDDGDYSDMEFSAKYSLGFEYKVRLSKKESLSGSFKLNGSHRGIDEFSLLSGKNLKKFYGASDFSQDSFAEQKYELSNVSARRREQIYFSPSMNIASNKKSDARIKYNVNIFGNIPVMDRVKINGENFDMRNTGARVDFGASLRLNF